MALICPVVVGLIMGAIEGARVGMVAQLLTVAARDGCRVAVLSGSTQADIQAQIVKTLDGSGITVGTITPTCTSPYTWSTAPQGTPVTVTLSVNYVDVSWIGPPFFLSQNA